MEVYSLKAFHTFIVNSIGIAFIITKFRQDICDLTIDRGSIDTIFMRINYYNAILTDTIELVERTFQSNLILIPPPKEPCFSKLFRMLFTAKPEPYHYDFIIQCSPEAARKNVISQLKQRFGYSRKSNSTHIKPSLGSSPCLRLYINSSIHKMSKTRLVYPDVEKNSNNTSQPKRVKLSLSTPSTIRPYSFEESG